VKAENGDPEPERRAVAEAGIIGCSDAVTASSTTEESQLAVLYDAPADRIEIVPPGVDHAFFSPGDQRGARFALGLGDEPVLLFVGRVQPLKRLGVAIEVLAGIERQDATLVAVGGPSGRQGAAELDRLRGRAHELGVADRIRWVDPVPHHLLSTYYRAADVCLVPSRSESFGLVALEAAACGIPVVAAAVGGLRSIVEHGRTGFLVDGGDPTHFTAYVDEVLSHPTLALELGTAAAGRARTFTWSTTAARLRRLYADLATRALVRC
jgi:D-inositol-3-phosphate glycosyltransferase